MDQELNKWICTQLSLTKVQLRWYDIIMIVHELEGDGKTSMTTRAGLPAVKVKGSKVSPHTYVYFVRKGYLKIGRIKLKHRTWSREVGHMDHYLKWAYTTIIDLLLKRNMINNQK